MTGLWTVRRVDCRIRACRLALLMALIGQAQDQQEQARNRRNTVIAQPLSAVWNGAGRSPPGQPGNLRDRKPGRRDYVFFLLATPLLMSLWIAALGIRPIGELGFAAGWFYLGSRVLIAWWGGHLGALAAAHLVRDRGWALWRILLLGFLIAWLPLTVLLYCHLLMFSWLYPDHAATLSPQVVTFTSDYLLRLFSRSTVFFLPLWMATVHGYRRQFGVGWYTQREAKPATQLAGRDGLTDATSAFPAVPAVIAEPERPCFLQQSKLPPESRVQTLKAAEHYIEVVSDCGSDLVRYRFNDAIREMAAMDTGGQVHRSWWVCWDSVARMVQRGSGLDLVLHDGRTIPVSHAWKNEVRRRCSDRNQSQP